MLHRSLIAHDPPPTMIHPAKAAFDLPALAITWPGLDRTPTFRPAPLAAFNVGMVGLMPRRRRRWRKAWLSYALSATSPSGGFVAGHVFAARARWPRWPPPTGSRGVGHSQRATRSASLGHRPRPSPSSPCRLWSCRRRSPFFRRDETAVQERLCPVKLALGMQLAQQGPPELLPGPVCGPVRKRRQHVAGEPYVRGTSSQGQPVFSTKRMPLSVRRSSCRLRPGPACCFGMKGSMTAHCSSVRSCRLIPTI